MLYIILRKKIFKINNFEVRLPLLDEVEIKHKLGVSGLKVGDWNRFSGCAVINRLKKYFTNRLNEDTSVDQKAVKTKI